MKGGCLSAHSVVVRLHEIHMRTEGQGKQVCLYGVCIVREEKVNLRIM